MYRLTAFTWMAMMMIGSIDGHDRVGGFTKVPANDDNKADFYKTMTQGKFTRSNDPFVCVTKFGHVYQQVVSGMNYKFHVDGCAVDSPVNAQSNCVCEKETIQKYVIEMYVQGWSDIYQVHSVMVVPNQRHDL